MTALSIYNDRAQDESEALTAVDDNKNSQPDISFLIKIFEDDQHLNLKISDENRVAYEKKKLESIETFYAIIMSQHKEVEKTQRFMLLRKIAVHALTACGLVLDGSGNFLFAKSLFDVIPGVSSPVSLVGTIILTLANCFLFYSFEAALLRKAFGITETGGNTEMFFNICSNQASIAKKINRELVDINFVDKSSLRDYESYVQLAIFINADLNQKKTNFAPTENVFLTAAKYLIIALGAVMQVAGTYYFVTSILVAASASLVGTPLGWSIIGASIVCSLVFYAAMRASGANSKNPTLQAAEDMHKKLNKFEFTDTKLNGALNIKRGSSLFSSVESRLSLSSQSESSEIVKLKFD